MSAADIAAFFNGRCDVPGAARADYPDRGAWDARTHEGYGRHSTEPRSRYRRIQKILGHNFFRVRNGRALNTHPGLLPGFSRGAGTEIVTDAAGPTARKVTGFTGTWWKPANDTGPIRAQQSRSGPSTPRR